MALEAVLDYRTHFPYFQEPAKAVNERYLGVKDIVDFLKATYHTVLEGLYRLVTEETSGLDLGRYTTEQTEDLGLGTKYCKRGKNGSNGKKPAREDSEFKSKTRYNRAYGGRTIPPKKRKPRKPKDEKPTVTTWPRPAFYQSKTREVSKHQWQIIAERNGQELYKITTDDQGKTVYHYRPISKI